MEVVVYMGHFFTGQFKYNFLFGFKLYFSLCLFGLLFLCVIVEWWRTTPSVSCRKSSKLLNICLLLLCLSHVLWLLLTTLSIPTMLSTTQISARPITRVGRGRRDFEGSRQIALSK